MAEQAEVQYTVRGVPGEVDKALRKKAVERGQSLNQTILDELMAATAVRPKRADFSDLVGVWVPDPLFDEIMAEQGQIEWDMWK